MNSLHSSRFAGWPRRQALAVTVLSIAAMAWCLWTARTRETLPLSDRSERIPPRFKLSAESLAALREEKVPEPILDRLRPLLDKNFPTEQQFRDALAEHLSAEQLGRYTDRILDKSRQSDLDVYMAVVSRVGAGENYYEALAAEFAALDFRSRSLFNWRTPIYAWVIGRWLGPRLAQLLLAVIALATILLWFKVIGQELDPWLAPLSLLLIGPFGFCLLGTIFFFTEVWVGVLIALSIAAYALERWPIGVAAGLVALFLRELALPYCLLCLAIALCRRRGRESLAWCGGLTLWAAFFAWHAHQAARFLPPGESLQLERWLRFGGMAFVIGTSQMNVFLINLPTLSALLLFLSLLGLAGWPGLTGIRLLGTTAGYLAFFAVVGMPNNAYWGLMITPLLSLGLAAAPLALRDLYRAVSRRITPAGRDRASAPTSPPASDR